MKRAAKFALLFGLASCFASSGAVSSLKFTQAVEVEASQPTEMSTDAEERAPRVRRDFGRVVLCKPGDPGSCKPIGTDCSYLNPDGVNRLMETSIVAALCDSRSICNLVSAHNNKAVKVKRRDDDSSFSGSYYLVNSEQDEPWVPKRRGTDATENSLAMLKKKYFADTGRRTLVKGSKYRVYRLRFGTGLLILEKIDDGHAVENQPSALREVQLHSCDDEGCNPSRYLYENVAEGISGNLARQHVEVVAAKIFVDKWNRAVVAKERGSLDFEAVKTDLQNVMNVVEQGKIADERRSTVASGTVGQSST